MDGLNFVQIHGLDCTSEDVEEKVCSRLDGLCAGGAIRRKKQ